MWFQLHLTMKSNVVPNMLFYVDAIKMHHQQVLLSWGASCLVNNTWNHLQLNPLTADQY